MGNQLNLKEKNFNKLTVVNREIMVCSFMLIVLPALCMRAMYWVWSFFTGKKATVPAAPKNAGEKEVKKGVCPYHVFMNFFGFKIPEKKAVAADPQKVNNDETPIAKEVKAE